MTSDNGSAVGVECALGPGQARQVTLLTLLWIAQAALALLAVLGNCLVLGLGCKSKVLPINLRTFLIFFATSALVGAAYFLVRSSVFVHYSCKLHLTYSTCRIVEIPFALSLHSAVWIALFATIDRIYSCCTLSVHHNTVARKLALIGCFIVWQATVTEGIFANLFGQWSGNSSSNASAVDHNLLLSTSTAVQFCALFSRQMLSKVTHLQYVLPAYVAVELCLLGVVVCWRKQNRRHLINRYINQSTISLLARMSAKQNIEIGSMLLPVVSLHALFYMVTFTQLTAGLYGNLTDIDFLLLGQACYLYHCLFLALYPLVMVKAAPNQVKRETSTLINACFFCRKPQQHPPRKRGHTKSIEESDLRIQQLQESWEKVYTNKQKRESKPTLMKLIDKEKA